MLTDDQLIDALRHTLATETDRIAPRPDLLRRVHQELDAIPGGRRAGRWPRFRADAVLLALAAGVAVGVAVVALVALHHSTPTPTPATNPVAVGTIRIAARTPDPHGGLPWGLRTTQTRRLRACLQIGRLKSDRIGALGQDDAFDNDRRFHPIPLHSSFPCGRTDAHGHLFLNVLESDIPASAALGRENGCRAQLPARVMAHLPKSARRRLRKIAPCPRRDLRNVAFGVLGPDAVNITYTANHRTVTEKTGPDGAYVVVKPDPTQQLCTFDAHGGKGCFNGEETTATLQSGLITSVRYRDGHVCRLETLTSAGAGATSCPNVGYAHYAPLHVPHITHAQVASPMRVRILKAKHYCYKIHVKFGSFQIPCDHGIPHGYHLENSTEAPHIALVDISFTARLAANNHHSVYEFSYGRATGPKNCTLNTGSTDATTMAPIRAGQRVTIQDSQEVCPGTYTGLVTYQPNGAPGRDTLDRASPIHDHSILVGRFKYTLRK